MKRWIALFMALTLLLASACGGDNNANEPADANQPAAQDPVTSPADPAEQEPETEPEPEPEPVVQEPYNIYDPTVMPEGGVRDGVAYAAYDGLVEHLFFHPIIAYPELAFDGDAQEKGLDDFMVTEDEITTILDS